MAEEHGELDMHSSTEVEEKVDVGSHETSEKTEDSEQGCKADETFPLTHFERKNETAGSEPIIDSQLAVNESSEEARLFPASKKSPKRTLLKPIYAFRNLMTKRRNSLESKSEGPSTVEASFADSPSMISNEKTTYQSQETTPILLEGGGARESSSGVSQSKKDEGGFTGKLRSAVKGYKNIKSLLQVQRRNSTGSEQLPIVMNEESTQMDTDRTTSGSVLKTLAPQVKKLDLESLDVVPKVYDISPDETVTTTVEDSYSEGKKIMESSDTDAQRSGQSSLEFSDGATRMSSQEKKSEESPKCGSSDMVADVSSGEKGYEKPLKTQKRTPLKRQRKVEEDDSSDSDTGIADRSPQKRVPTQKRTTRL